MSGVRRLMAYHIMAAVRSACGGPGELAKKTLARVALYTLPGIPWPIVSCLARIASVSRLDFVGST